MSDPYLCRECGSPMDSRTNKCSSERCRLTTRTCRIINKGGSIYLKRKDGWYLGCWTNIAAGPDQAQWSKRDRLEIFNLEWAFAIAPLYDCKVVVVYPKKRKQS